MSEPSQRPPIASAPISVILFARAFATDAPEALQAWQLYLQTLKLPCEIIVIQETRPEVAPAAEEVGSSIRTITYDRAAGFRDTLNDAIRSAQHPLVAFCTCDMQH